MAKVVGTADWRSRIGTKEGPTTMALGPQAFVQTRDPRYVSDAYQYYLQGMGGGQDAAGIPATTVAQAPAAPVTTGGGGGQGLAVAPGITGTSAAQNMGGGVNTPFEQNLINQGAGVQIAPGQPVVAPGEMPVTQAEMDAFNQIQPKTTTPSGDVFAGGNYSDVAGTLADPTEKIDFTPETKNIFQKAGQTVSGAAEDLKNAGYNVVQQGKDLIAKIGGKSIDIGKTIGTGAMNLIGHAATGVPLLGTAAQMIGGALPKQDPRQTALNELYDVKDGTIQSGLMAGYNPVSGGIPGVSDPTYGLQDAYDKRIGTIENTLKDKYNMTDAEIADVRAGNYTGDVDSDLLQRLTDLDEAKAKEKDRLDLFSGDIQDTGDAGLAELEAAKTRAGIQPTDPFLDIPDRQYAEPTAGVNPFADIDTGAGEFNITAPIQLGPEQIQKQTPDNILAGAGGFDYMDVSDEDLLGPTQTTTGGPPSVFEDMDTGVGEFDDIDVQGLNQAARAATQIGGQTALMRSGAKGLYSPVDIMKTGTTPERASQILNQGFRGGTAPTWAGKGKTFVGDPNVAKMYGDEILDVATPAGGARTIGGGIGKRGLTIGEEVALDPKTATRGLSLAQRLAAGQYPSSPTAQRLLQTGTTAARPIAKIAGRALPGVGAALAAQDAYARAKEGDYIGAGLGAASAIPLAGIPFLGAQMGYDLLRSDLGADTLAGRPDLPDLMDEFDMTAFDEPIETPVDPAAMSLAEARAAMTQPTGIQMPGARTPIEIGEIDPYQESYVFPNEIITQPMSEFDTRQEKDRIVKQREDKQRVDDQRAMQEQIAAAERQEAARQAQAEQAAQRARDEAAANAREQAAQRARDEAASRAREQAASRAREEAARKAQERMNQRSIPDRGRGQTPSRSVSTAGQAGPPSQRGGGGGNGPSSCFLKGTPITMADGTIKPVEQVYLGDKVAVGGKVFAVGRFLNNDLYDYKGVKVSGSHTVNEDGNWVRVEDSKHGKALGDDEHTVYVFGAENRRILINNILFTDYFEVNEQKKLMENEEDYFKNWKSYIKKDDINKINVLNAS